jgi:ParB family chromosome partitioning protein
MPRRTGLGRGLDALIPSTETITTSGGIVYLPVKQIKPNPRQPRTNFDPVTLAELSESIKEHGVIQPLIVTYDEENDAYILIAGERRWIAAQQAGLESIPALIRSASDQERLEIALIENLQRQDLNPLESAEAYRQLVDDFQISHEEISRRVGKSRTTITNTLRLLKLAPSLQAALVGGLITEGHARCLLTLNSSAAQENALAVILARELNVRQSEELVRRLSGRRPLPASKPSTSPEEIDIVERLRDHLGTRVQVHRRKHGGTIVIHYYSDEELNNLIAHILKE